MSARYQAALWQTTDAAADRAGFFFATDSSEAMRGQQWPSPRPQLDGGLAQMMKLYLLAVEQRSLHVVEASIGLSRGKLRLHAWR